MMLKCFQKGGKSQPCYLAIFDGQIGTERYQEK